MSWRTLLGRTSCLRSWPCIPIYNNGTHFRISCTPPYVFIAELEGEYVFLDVWEVHALGTIDNALLLPLGRSSAIDDETGWSKLDILDGCKLRDTLTL